MQQSKYNVQRARVINDKFAANNCSLVKIISTAKFDQFFFYNFTLKLRPHQIWSERRAIVGTHYGRALVFDFRQISE